MVDNQDKSSVRTGEKLRCRLGCAVMVAIILIVLLPFANKAFHIDDTLSIYPARQIVKSPLRPFNFEVNWFGKSQSMWREGNPPLIFYYIALMIYLFGESEISLHISFLIFPLVAGVAMYYLAKRFVKSAFLSTFFFVASPAFLVMSTNIMLDIPLLAFYLAAVITYVYGVDRDNVKFMVFSMILTGFACLTKYVGLTLIPLLMGYSFLKRRNLPKDMLFFLIPLALFGLWCVHNVVFYGSIHLLESSRFLRLHGHELFEKTLGTLSYLGGTIVFLLLFLGLFPMTRRDGIIFLLSICGSVFIFAPMLMGLHYSPGEVGCVIFFVLLAVFFFLKGITNFTAGILTKVRRKGSWAEIDITDDGFLLLWFLGILLLNVIAEFAGVRFILILLPPVILLIFRVAEGVFLPTKIGLFKNLCWVGSILTLIMALLVTHGDYKYAKTYQDFSKGITTRWGEKDRKIWFSAHWGFQYYMEEEGATCLSLKVDSPRVGDILIIPAIASYDIVCDFSSAEELGGYLTRKLHLLEIVTYKSKCALFCTMHRERHAGFYSHYYGFLPYAILPRYLEKFYIWQFQ